MSNFATLADAGSPLRLLQVGAGNMGMRWLRAILDSPDVELAGLVDLDTDAANEALEAVGAAGIPVGTRLSEVASSAEAHAVVNVTVPQAHHPVTTEALFAGLPVLSEKPLAPTVSQGLSLAAASEASGQLLMVSQSRRYFPPVDRFRERIATLGELGVVTTEFFRPIRVGGFREEMEHVLLVDMAIHAFDLARHLLGQDPVAVYCEEFNPRWSWFKGAAGASAIFEMRNSTRYVYTGNWSSDGFKTSWNGQWRVSAERGTGTWDGENRIGIDIVGSNAGTSVEDDEHGLPWPDVIGGPLAEFVHALRTGTTPYGEVHRNLMSLAMVEAAVSSAETRQRVLLSDVLDAARKEAISHEQKPQVREILERGR